MQLDKNESLRLIHVNNHSCRFLLLLQFIYSREDSSCLVSQLFAAHAALHWHIYTTTEAPENAFVSVPCMHNRLTARFFFPLCLFAHRLGLHSS